MQLDAIEIVRTKYRDWFACYKNDNMISTSLRMYGEYQQIELDILATLIQPNTVVYDVGSNIGYHATAFSHMCDQVYCFEAHPQHYEVLKFNLRQDPHCRAFNLALGDREGIIHVDGFDVNKTANYGTVSVGNESPITVKMTSIDTLVESGLITPPDFIKIDVEGYEPQVLLGAKNTVSRHRPGLYIEAQVAENTEAIYNFLAQFDYRTCWVTVRNFNADNFNRNHENVFGNSAIFSILALPSEVKVDLPYPMQGPTDTWEKFVQRTF